MIRSSRAYDRPRPARDTPGPHEVVLFVAGVAALFFVGGLTLEIHLGEPGLLAAEWLLLLMPAVLFVRIRRFDARRTLSVGAPASRGWVAAILMVAGALPMGWGMGWLQSRVLPVPHETLQGLEQLVTADTPQRLAWLLFLLALTPAVCEEMVFRGVLLGGTRSLETWRILLLNGVVFGAFHLSLGTVVRFLATAWLGIVITWTVLRTGSIWTGVLMHFLNNGAIVLLASVPALRQMIGGPEAPPPLWLIPAAALSLAVGLRVLSGMPDATVVEAPTESEKR
jgi:membrane protease YdiL (CAAX protease family)